MNLRVVIPILAVAAIAVAIENVLLLRSDASAVAGGADWEDPAENGGEDAPIEALPPISHADLLRYLAQLADGEGARNPFLTRDEIERLAARAGDDRHMGGASDHPLVSGTLWSPMRRVAWLDGIPHSEGDDVGEHRVARIEAASVVLERGSESIRVEVSGDGD